MAGMMLRTYELRSSTFMLLLWKSYLKPIAYILENSSQVRNDILNVLNISKEGLQEKNWCT